MSIFLSVRQVEFLIWKRTIAKEEYWSSPLWTHGHARGWMKQVDWLFYYMVGRNLVFPKKNSAPCSDMFIYSFPRWMFYGLIVGRIPLINSMSMFYWLIVGRINLLNSRWIFCCLIADRIHLLILVECFVR